MSRTPRAYYNEFDPKAAAWLRQLIAEGLIADGDVDERSITDVQGADLVGYTQCHFFAGIGGWGYALRLAGWPDDRPVWTGSCPCQPFSVAGKGRGTADERHLWPQFARLIGECRPPVVFGEQVASAAGRAWFGAVRADLEALAYASAALDACAAGIGAPHIRQRLWWAADALSQRRQLQPLRRSTEEFSDLSGTGDVGERSGTLGTRAGRMGHAEGADRGLSVFGRGPREDRVEPERSGEANRPRPSDLHWATPDWLYCQDGKWRPVEPGTCPLVNGLPRGVVPSGDPGDESYAQSTAEGRAMRLRGYGNAIVPQLAAAFVECYMEAQS